MSGTKRVILPTQILTDQSLEADFESAAIDITYLDRVSIELDITTSDALGVFKVESSVQGDHWVALDMDQMASDGADKVILMDIQVTGLKQIRVAYTATSGTGTVNGYLTAKEA